MKTHNSIHFVILIPHAAVTGPLRRQSRFLFAAGINGAWSFPQAAPLARLERPFTPAELKTLAGELRNRALQNNAGDGRITLGPQALVPCPGFHGFFGPVLDLPPPSLPYPGVLYPFPRLILCTALIAPSDTGALEKIPAIPPVSPGFFRVAMVANLRYKSLAGAFSPGAVPDPAENYSFTWRIGKPRWLPRGFGG
jgi:hypothetical protein